MKKTLTLAFALVMLTSPALATYSCSCGGSTGGASTSRVGGSDTRFTPSSNFYAPWRSWSQRYRDSGKGPLRVDPSSPGGHGFNSRDTNNSGRFGGGGGDH
ncbi:MAG: hypothetical protein ACREF4_03625 [Gammaproteobacteria bacterium]